MAVSTIKYVASGDLTSRVDIVSKDEIGLMLSAINNMTGSMSDIIKKIFNSSFKIADASELILSGSDKVIAGAEHQTIMTTQISSSMEAILADMLNSTKKLEEVSKSSEDASEIAENGGELIFQAI